MTEDDIEDGYERTVSGLLRKRAEIAGEVKAKQDEVQRLQTDLNALDRALRVFGLQRDLSDVVKRPSRSSHLKRGEPMRLVLRAIAVSPGATTHEIAEKVMEIAGLDRDDGVVREDMRRTVYQALKAHLAKGRVRNGERKGVEATWERAA
ncbi:MAG: hypothetical protein HEQ16_13065 [Bosea sp.]|jgi:hypothetical protein|nr:hypothetical protein [Bosea sp. (in: a-proteobacteria)]